MSWNGSVNCKQLSQRVSFPNHWSSSAKNCTYMHHKMFGGGWTLSFWYVFSLRTASTQPNLQTNVWKIRKINWASSSQATSFKLGEYNLPPSILALQFTNCVKFNFVKSYLPSDSHTNTVISDHFAYSSRWYRKPW